MKVVSLVLILLLTTLGTAKGQLLERKEALPGVLVRRGYAPQGYWSVETFNDQGHIQYLDQGRNDELRSRKEFIYNERGDVLTKIQAFSINRPDTSYRTTYHYCYDSVGIIKQQITVLHQGDSIIYNGQFVPAEDCWIYQQRIVHREQDGTIRETAHDQYRVKYTKNDRLQSWKRDHLPDQSGSLNTFSYDESGQLAEKLVKTIPGSQERAVPYTMVYSYRYNRNGYLKLILLKRSPEESFKRVVRYRYQLK